jgi:anti-sigma factor ChrR (cupin superfamily)
MVSAGTAPTTVRTNFAVIRAVLNLAIDERVIDRAPVKRIVLPDFEAAEHATASFDTLLALIDELPPKRRKNLDATRRRAGVPRASTSLGLANPTIYSS